MLRRPPTTLCITAEDVAGYEDRRAREAFSAAPAQHPQQAVPRQAQPAFARIGLSRPAAQRQRQRQHQQDVLHQPPPPQTQHGGGWVSTSDEEEDDEDDEEADDVDDDDDDNVEARRDDDLRSVDETMADLEEEDEDEEDHEAVVTPAQAAAAARGGRVATAAAGAGARSRATRRVYVPAGRREQTQRVPAQAEGQHLQQQQRPQQQRPQQGLGQAQGQLVTPEPRMTRSRDERIGTTAPGRRRG